MKVTLTLGPDTFAAEGDFHLDDPDFREVLTLWLEAPPRDGSADAVAALTTRLKAANDALAATVAATTPTP